MTEEQNIEQQVEEQEIDKTVALIRSGDFDGSFDKIVAAMGERRETRKQAVLAQVREVYGQNAVVSIPSVPTDKALSEHVESNPFLRKQQSTDEMVTNEMQTLDNNEVGDALSGDTGDIEKRMIEESAAEQLPIERRGAIIGGLSSSDIGE